VLVSDLARFFRQFPELFRVIPRRLGYFALRLRGSVDWLRRDGIV